MSLSFVQMKSIFFSHPLEISTAFLLIVFGSTTACAPALASAPKSFATTQVSPPCVSVPQSAPEVVTQTKSTPTIAVSPDQIPNIPGLMAQREFDTDGKLVAADYRNSDGAIISVFDPQDKVHNSQVAWNWEQMTRLEKDQALQWIFMPPQMSYRRFENREEWAINAVTKWIPRLDDFSLLAAWEIAQHWPSDGPPLSQLTLYEALSRIKSLTLVRERPMCSYGYSHLGLIEYGGEIVLFAAPAWQKVSLETREILTVVWTIKESMVIYYPQAQGWANSCPSEVGHLKNESYSTIWLLQAERVLSKFVPADKGYWENQEIPFQIRNIRTQTFPRCLQPAP